jgi:RluA family pseudouridine synthase
VQTEPSEPRTIRLGTNGPKVQVVYEDADLLAISKPAGLLVAPDRWDKSRENLMGLLDAAIRAGMAWTRESGIRYLANVHRLDFETTGVLLLAKNREALTKVARQFGRREVGKTYVALAWGRPAQPQMTIDLKISPHPRFPGLAAIDKRHGKPATTLLTLVESFRNCSLVRLQLLTGRPHQARVHLHAIGCPLVADRDYGRGDPLLLSQIKPHYRMKDKGERPLMGRTALHAERLEVTQPTTGLPAVIEAPWPKDFVVAVKYLRMFAPARGAAAGNQQG